VLAALYRASSLTAAPADSAMLWLRVGPDGRVPPGGWTVVSATSDRMHYAAAQLVPYLRYSPGMKDGRGVPVWMAQRLVVEP
jgi:hypothetical protein